MYGLMGGLMGSCQNYWKWNTLIKIPQVYLKIYDLWRFNHLWVDVWFDGWMSGWGSLKMDWCMVWWLMESCQITKNKMKLELIEIFHFIQLGYFSSVWRFMICGDFASHTSTHSTHPVVQSFGIEILRVSSIVQLFDILTIDVSCVTANYGHLISKL